MKPEHQNSEIPELDHGIPENAVSLYGQADAMDDFPVLKAFQQYIDSEQAKARKRMLMLCVFFGVLMTVVVTVFLVLLLGVSSRNQALNDRLVEYLNDRLVEYAMKERERMSSPIVVQPQQPQQDNSAILALATKLEELQKKLEESREKDEETRRQAEIEAVKPKGPTPEEIEIKRLNALLAAEKAKQEAEKARLAAEKERQHQIEIEEYRRKHYPEFYEKKAEQKPQKDEHAELMREIDDILEDGDAKTYFEEEDLPKMTRPSRVRKPKTAAPAQKEYSIPVDVRGSSGRWSVPND